VLTRRRFTFSVLALAAVLGVATGCDETAKPRVLLISIDGFRWDYRDRFETPVLDALAAAGVSAGRMQPGFPTKTFPNHFTLVTGLVPDHHGIVSNTIRDPAIPGVTFSMSNRDAVRDARWWDAEPIWATLEKEGHRTAPLLWPGSEADIGGIEPWRSVEYVQNLSDDTRIGMVMDLFSGPESAWPSFATMYWHAVDDAGHRFGPGSAEVKAAVEGVDAALGRLLAALRARDIAGLNVIVVSDHGMSQLAPERTVYLEDYIDVDAIETVDSTPNVGIFSKTVDADTLAAQLTGRHPAMQVYRPGAFPDRLQFGTHRRVPPVFVSMADGWSVLRTRGTSRGYAGLGNHGYDNALDSMQALFVAAGPAFRPGVHIERMRSVDVYEVMCAILGITPNRNDGDPSIARRLLGTG
jgi:predicted AlkP superfamily pyrophosphatase or phosphodiesterase